MTFKLPTRDTVEESRRALREVEQDRKARRAARLQLSFETGDPSLGPGMW
ncbi:hypothetical protein HTZ84_09815 [Haloterrigena sp. SYSU A558-1]|uniref:Uncharacterized protein n=1 Tax=Haloterrigena gelatinilytica TaxID=2741724 RepID=A0ABX2LG80_9EURY|nr:hypothetical protein [Haloterrigena gelatinilytica]NUC72602.1 hypothetical protein [Haloterrigena gelatinilytica]